MILEATRRDSIDDALNWIAAGWKVAGHVSLDQLLRAVIRLSDHPGARGAAQRLARMAAASELNSGNVIFGLDEVDTPATFRRALDRLAAVCKGGTLENIDDHAVVAAQRDEPFTVEALCAVAGLAYRDLADRMQGSAPQDSASSWSPAQIRNAFSVINAIVTGTEACDVENAVPVRPIDLIPELRGTPVGGWATVEAQRSKGVPYEVLLAQRAAGGAWLAHRNRTARHVRHWVADRLAAELEQAGIAFRRSSEAGGDDAPASVMAATGCGKQIGLAVLDAQEIAVYAVVFAVARDSGTARKSIGSLIQMARPVDLPVAVVVSGPGWARRNAMVELAMAFGGRIYADARIDPLVGDIRVHLDARHQGGSPA